MATRRVGTSSRAAQLDRRATHRLDAHLRRVGSAFARRPAGATRLARPRCRHGSPPGRSPPARTGPSPRRRPGSARGQQVLVRSQRHHARRARRGRWGFGSHRPSQRNGRVVTCRTSTSTIPGPPGIPPPIEGTCRGLVSGTGSSASFASSGRLARRRPLGGRPGRSRPVRAFVAKVESRACRTRPTGSGGCTRCLGRHRSPRWSWWGPTSS